MPLSNAQLSGDKRTTRTPYTALRFSYGCAVFFLRSPFHPSDLSHPFSGGSSLSQRNSALHYPSPDFLQVIHEGFHLRVTRFLILRPQD